MVFKRSETRYSYVVTEEVTRDYVPNIQHPERRQAMLLPWIPCDFKDISYEQTEPDPSFFSVSNNLLLKSMPNNLALESVRSLDLEFIRLNSAVHILCDSFAEDIMFKVICDSC